MVSPRGSDLTSIPNIVAMMQDLSLAKCSDDASIQQGTARPTTPQPATIGKLPMQPPMGMVPLMFHPSFSPNMPYLLNRVAHTGQMNPMTPLNGTYPILGPVYQAPPSPAPTAQTNYSPSRTVSSYNSRMDARRQNATRVNRSPYYNAGGHHNHVDVCRIRDGIDVRTTVSWMGSQPGLCLHLQIMLRNIPNKVDQAMLKRIIDESSWGKYDFMYLRIDFANDCK